MGRLGEPELGCARRSPPDSDLGLGLGLDDVTVDVLAHLGRVSSADDFVRGFSMILSWVVGAGWSEELRREHPLEEVQGFLRGFLEKYGGRGWDLTWLSIVASARVKGA